ncbi:MAG: NAD(P)-dependent oxidoreductase [Thiolinea sp.]
MSNKQNSATQGTASVTNGEALIAWATKHMPVLQASLLALEDSGAISGIRIAVALQLEAKSASFILGLQRAGAKPIVYSRAAPDSAAQDIASALHNSGIAIANSIDALFEARPQILLDDGAELIQHAQTNNIPLIGASETSAAGIRAIEALPTGQNPFNIVDLNTSTLKQLIENEFGVGQSCVMAFVDITNLQLAGRPVAVIGYGNVGRGVAAHAQAFGARVVIAETDPVKTVAARYQGHQVSTTEEALTNSEVVFCAADEASALTIEHISSLRDGAFLCIAGEAQTPALNYLMANAEAKTLRTDVVQYTFGNGRSVKLIAQGKTLNNHGGEGSPIEAMDISLALQLEAIKQLLAPENSSRSTPCILGIDAKSESKLAEVILESL